MKKVRVSVIWIISLIMILQIVLPTVSYAADTIKLNIQKERPYNDDDGDGTVGNDIYSLTREAIQTVFKIGEQDSEGNLNFDTAYYCLRGGLGFGSTEEILAQGVDYKLLANLSDSNKIIEYFKDTIGYDIPTKNYNAICWLADNMYLPKSQYAKELKDTLLNNAGITSSQLTDDDIEVIEQIALWYFSNYDENGEPNSVSLAKNVDISAALLINGKNYDNNLSALFNKNRAAQMKTLYEYLINTAEREAENYNPEKTIVTEKMELDKNLKPTIETKTVAKQNAKIVGPFKINELQKGNVDYTFSYELKYKTAYEQEDWSTVEIDNTMGTVYLSDANGNAIDNRNKTVQDMIAQEQFYVTILVAPLNIATITDFELNIKYTSYYYNTTATVLVAGNEDQPVLKVEKEKVENTETDKVQVKLEEKEFDLALRKFITTTNGTKLTGEYSRVPQIYLNELRNGTSTTANYEHSKAKNIILRRGDTIVYTIRIYNEGEVDGYATKVTDYLSEGLELVENSAINNKYGWTLGTAKDGKVTIETNYLADKLIKAYNPEVTQREVGANDLWQQTAEENGTDGLYYRDLEIECRIKDTAEVGEWLPNIAEITGAKDVEGNEITNPGDDRDSTPDNLEDLRNYQYTYPNSTIEEDDDDYEWVSVAPDKVFDLALRKYITKVTKEDTEKEIDSRNPKITQESLDALDNKTTTTATYNHRKDPVEVETGDIVTYNLTIYNEGEIAGRATKVVDQLPTGLEFVKVVSGNYEVESYNQETNKLTLVEKQENINLNAKEEGRNLDSTTITIECKVTAKVAEKDQILTNIAFISEEYNAEKEETITNQRGADRDSEPATAPSKTADELVTTDVGYTGKDTHTREELTNSDKYFKGEQDDDDFEKLILKGKQFDLALRKYIDNIERKGQNIEFPSRVPSVDTSKLNTINENGELITTAKYIHLKDAITVKQGDIITYKLRIYNEGQLDGYATKITDYIPEGLGLLMGYSGNDWWKIESEAESQPLVGEKGWYKTEKDVPADGILKDEDLSKITIVQGKKTETGRENLVISNNSLKEELIKQYGTQVANGDKWQQSVNNSQDGLFYQEVEVTCIVLAPNTWQEKIVNIAEVSEDKAVDETGTEVAIDDRDSKPDDVDLKDYELKEDNSTYQEDDDDYEPIQLKFFDLALRKFITGVNDEKVDTRIPEFYIDEDGSYKYKHDKTPVEVVDKDNVTYTIRVFNEGSIAGYAEEIEDDIPEGLVFLPENETNKEYRWVMYREAKEDEDLTDKNTVQKEGKVYVETENAEEAVIIRTDYLSEANGKVDEETGKNSNLLEFFDKNTMESPDYRDVKVVFKVVQKNIPESNKDGIIINKAQITEDSDDDEDSKPNEWNEGEDDQDKEYIYVQKFDLALFKWVTQTIVTVDGKTTTTETGFKPNIGKTEQSGENYRGNEEAEPIAAVTLDKKKLKSTVVKFVYNIKVVNEGDIEGYATEITDYIPEGLKFEQEDNPLWTLAENGKITTRALETVLLKPGESTTIPVTFTWINDANNLGVKKNIAAITEDYNDKHVEDEDSTPGNEDIPNYDKEQEDDDDFALVILTLKTGNEKTYIGLLVLVITIITAGTVIIKKYVL